MYKRQDQSVCDQSIVDQSISDTSVNDKSVLTESTVCDDDKVNDNDNDDDIKLPDERTCIASSNEIAQEQRHDKSLAACFKLAERGCGGFVVKDNLLYHRAKILGQSFLQLVVPTRADRVFDHFFVDCCGPFFVVMVKSRSITTLLLQSIVSVDFLSV